MSTGTGTGAVLWPMRLPGRWLVPLLVLVFAMLALPLHYHQQMHTHDQEVGAQELRRLRERLSVEQTRLDVQTSMDNPLMVRRLVSGLALHQGLSRAYLVGTDGRVQASLSRQDLGQPLTGVLARTGEPLAVQQALSSSRPLPAIEVGRVGELPLLTAQVPLQAGRRLVVAVDLSYPLALRRASVQTEVARESLALLAALGVLAVLLHVLWFRRAQRLAQSLADMGSGNLAARTGLQGGDELALIGRAADQMAGQLQAGQERIRCMADIINRSPLVVVEWRNAPGWPVSYVSESVDQWGYAPADLLDGQRQYSDLIHPDDVQRIHDEVAGYLAHGPDEYRQSYRIRCADGRWAWVEDRTSLTRGANGEVLSISGILLDTTAQMEAEQAQREQGELLRMFYKLPFLGMAISSPTDKRWLQVNDRLCEILGYTRDELLRMSWAEMTPPGDLDRNLVLFDELMAGQRSGYQMTKRFVRKDGRLVHTEIDVRAVHHADGSLNHLFSTIQDVSDRWLTEAALQRSDRQLREAQRIGRMGSWEFDLDTGQVLWSEEVHRIHETDAVRFTPTYETFLASIHPDDRERVNATYRASVDQTAPYEVEYRICLPDHRVKYLRVKGETERLDGRPVRTLGMVQDVTDITLAQQALQEKESQLAEAQDVAHLGNWIIDTVNNTAAWSRELFRMFGYDPEQVEANLGNFLRIVHPDDVARVQATVLGAMGPGAQPTYLLEHRIVVPDGVRHVEQRGRVSFDAEGRPVRLFGTTMDVTERREAERVMQDYKEMLEQAEELVLLGSWAGDADSQQLTISAQLFRNVGLDPSQHTPSDAEYLARIHPDDRALVGDDMRRIRAGLEADELVFRTDPAWGPMRWLRRTVRRIPREAEGRGPRYIGTLLDITEAVAAEERLKRLNQELEQRVSERTAQLSVANRELEAFSYSVSHDLKAPLRGIDGYSQLLLDDYSDRLDDDGRVFLQRIRQGVQKMGDLINDMLAYSRMERRDMAHEPVALVPLVEEVVDSYHADIQRTGAQVRLSMEPLTLPLDREGMAVVLRNLIGNALKFSRDSHPPTVEIGARSEAGRRILWVRDNGVGFDMRYQERMFGIFQRLHKAEEFPGTGVGLALVAKAVQRMGGRVWGESRLGEGATFYLEFPA